MQTPICLKDSDVIQIDKEDEVKGFYILLSQGSVKCLPNNEYIVPKERLAELVKSGIRFTVKKK